MEMAKMENNEIKNSKLIPRLRFPGFEGEWEEKLVKEICDINTGKSNTQDQVANGKYPFYIRSAVPVRSNRYLYDCEAVITIGDGQIGKVFHYVKGKFDLHQRCYMMSNFRKVDSRYFYHFFSNNFYDRAMRMSAKATVDSVRLEMISEMPILYPSLSEQQKIASCLSELDNLIAAQGQKVDALKEKKKGLMQQLFPQPGETTPRLRFPGFEGEWVEKKLGEVFEKINNGMAYNTYLTEGYPMSRIETISSGEIDYDRVGYSDIEPNEKYKLLVGDLLFSHINSETRIGRIAMYRGEKALYHGMNLLLLRAGHLYDKFFVFYQMDRTETRTNIQKLAKKAINQASVSTSDLKQVSVMIPPYLPEQQKIASCLSSLDDLIAAESAKVEALKDHKKGLMQQLFPQGSEISRFSNTDVQECAVSSEISRFSNTHLQTDARECAEPKQQTSKD